MRVTFLSALLLITALPPTEAGAGTFADESAVLTYRDGTRRAADYVREIAAANDAPMLAGETKNDVRTAWASFLDYQHVLDSLTAQHEQQNASWPVAYAAFLAQYRGALEMIDAAGRLPGADAVLNEPVQTLGLPSQTYSRMKFHWLNVARAAEFAALESRYRLSRRKSDAPIHAAIAEDAAYLLAAGRGKGAMETAANAVKIMQNTALSAWLPVQKGLAEWMGDTRVARGHRFLITDAQIATLARRLLPGDVLLERREWYVSNVGLPGFWPHTALYVGDAAARRKFFAGDAAVGEWLRSRGQKDGDFEAYLRRQHPQTYTARAVRQARVIEAVGEGVSLTTLERSAAADSLAALRPRAAKLDIAIAIDRAFGWVGRPYDFNFDSHTDAALVCSELVYKAYEPAIVLPLEIVLGRPTTPPNAIVRAFDEAYGTGAQQFDLVVFLDGNESEQRAVESSLDEFRSSWRRPKWHIFKR